MRAGIEFARISAHKKYNTSDFNYERDLNMPVI
jgi:hypothetical protein